MYLTRNLGISSKSQPSLAALLTDVVRGRERSELVLLSIEKPSVRGKVDEET